MDIDLNISNYSVEDLKHFFNLHSNNNNAFDKEILHNKMLELQDKMILCENVNNEFKRNFNHFLNDATTILLKSLHAEDAIQERKLDNLEINPTHPIVHIPKDPFIYTQSSQAFQGVVNPLERRIVTKVLSIDSEFRKPLHNKLHNQIEQITASNNFMFHLQAPLENVISMKLSALELPRLWHSISTKLSNNNFEIYLQNTDISLNIVLPDGNYTNAELKTSINNYFNNIQQGLEVLNFDINPINGKAFFYVDPGTPSTFYYELNFSCSGLGNYLGFNNQKYNVSLSDTYTNSFLQSPAVIYDGYVIGESSCGLVDNYIFVIVNDFNYNHESNIISSQTHNGFIGDNVLGRVTLNVSPDNLLINNPSDKIFKKREYFGPVRIRQLEIKIINKYNKVIDLLNNNFSLALEFQILYSS
jgi:hypothetical protein